jgi:hypothetical protein
MAVMSVRIQKLAGARRERSVRRHRQACGPGAGRRENLLLTIYLALAVPNSDLARGLGTLERIYECVARLCVDPS